MNELPAKGRRKHNVLEQIGWILSLGGSPRRLSPEGEALHLFIISVNVLSHPCVIVPQLFKIYSLIILNLHGINDYFSIPASSPHSLVCRRWDGGGDWSPAINSLLLLPGDPWLAPYYLWGLPHRDWSPHFQGLRQYAGYRHDMAKYRKHNRNGCNTVIRDIYS